MPKIRKISNDELPEINSAASIPANKKYIPDTLPQFVHRDLKPSLPTPVDTFSQDPVSAAKSEQSIQQTSVVINFDGVDKGAQHQELFVGSHLRANDQSLNESR